MLQGSSHGDEGRMEQRPRNRERKVRNMMRDGREESDKKKEGE